MDLRSKFAEYLGLGDSDVKQFEGDCSYRVFVIDSPGPRQGYYWVSSKFYTSGRFFPSEIIKMEHVTLFKHPSIASPIRIDYDSKLGLVYQFPNYRLLSDVAMTISREYAGKVRKHRKLITDSKFLGIFNQLIRVCEYVHSNGHFAIDFNPEFMAFSPSPDSNIVMLNLDYAGTSVFPGSKPSVLEQLKKRDDFLSRPTGDVHSLIGCMQKFLNMKYTSITPEFRTRMGGFLAEISEKKYYCNRLRIRLREFSTGPQSGKKIETDKSQYLSKLIRPTVNIEQEKAAFEIYKLNCDSSHKPELNNPIRMFASEQDATYAKWFRNYLDNFCRS